MTMTQDESRKVCEFEYRLLRQKDRFYPQFKKKSKNDWETFYEGSGDHWYKTKERAVSKIQEHKEANTYDFECFF